MSRTIPAYLQDHSSKAEESFTQLVGGELVAGGTSQDVIDPAAGRAFAQAPVADPAQVDPAC